MNIDEDYAASRPELTHGPYVRQKPFPGPGLLAKIAQTLDGAGGRVPGARSTDGQHYLK
jgi:hypothetical protein